MMPDTRMILAGLSSSPEREMGDLQTTWKHKSNHWYKLRRRVQRSALQLREKSPHITGTAAYPMQSIAPLFSSARMHMCRNV